MLGNECSDILIYGKSETCLNEECVVHSSMGLQHAQIINPSVFIQIKVVDHILAGVE
jgi:hypothetical protein